MTSTRFSEARRLLQAVGDMYAYCRTAEYPCGRWHSFKSGLWWAWRMR